MTIQAFLEKLKSNPKEVSFSDTIAIIDENYSFTPTQFQNGIQNNAAGENSGSCKVFYFAQIHNLVPAETLSCFGDYYFIEVLQNPDATNHQNIRNFMKTGWDGIKFEGKALAQKVQS